MEKKKHVYNPDDYTIEAKRARFLRVAQRRTNVLLNNIRLISNTSNKTLYQYTDADVAKIFDAIETKVAEARMKFNSAKKPEEFRLEQD